MWPAGSGAWESGLPKSLATGIQIALQSTGRGQRLVTSGSEQRNAKSSCCGCVLEWGCLIPRNCPSNSQCCPHTTHRRACVRTRETCPGRCTHHQPSPQPNTVSGNLGGFSEEEEALTLQMLTHCQQVRAPLTRYMSIRSFPYLSQNTFMIHKNTSLAHYPVM